MYIDNVQFTSLASFLIVPINLQVLCSVYIYNTCRVNTFFYKMLFFAKVLNMNRS